MIKSNLTALLREEIETGITMATDPTNANRPALARRVTTLHSDWFMHTCPECRNKFREGDLVRQCPRCDRAYHDDGQYELHCWQTHFADGQVCIEGGTDRFNHREIPRCDYVWTGELPDDADPGRGDSFATSPPAAMVTQLLDGLQTNWSPFGRQPIVKVQAGDDMIGFRCPWCRLRVRVGDWVTACPCDCGTYFHQDVFRHLTCWNEWNGISGNDHCPDTGRPYPRERDG